MVPSWIQFLDVTSIEEHSAFCRIVEALNHRNDSRFPTATCSTECNNAILVVLDCEGNAFQDLDRLLAWIVELEVSDLNRSFSLLIRYGLPSSSVDVRRNGKQFNDLICCSEDACDVTEDAGHNCKVHQKHQHVEEEG